MLKTFLACMLFAFLIFLVLQVSELKAHVQLLEETIAETATLENMRKCIKEFIQK